MEGRFVKFTTIGVYLEEAAVKSLASKWSGKTADELTAALDFYEDIINGNLLIHIIYTIYIYIYRVFCIFCKQDWEGILFNFVGSPDIEKKNNTYKRILIFYYAALYYGIKTN